MDNRNETKDALKKLLEQAKQTVEVAMDFQKYVEEIGTPWILESLDLDKPDEYNPELAYRYEFVDINRQFAEEMTMQAIERVGKFESLLQVTDSELAKMIKKQAGRVNP